MNTPARTSAVTAMLLIGALVASCSADSLPSVDVVRGYMVPNEQELTLEVGACMAELVVIVEESPDEITVLIQEVEGTDMDCTGAEVVELAEPLGDRRVIDRHDDLEIEVLLEE